MASTPAAYDAIAKDYQRTKASPVRAAIETFTLNELLGDSRGLAVLDAGCGDGFHARRLMAAGAVRVAGVDVSPAMIGLAREQERAEPLGIQYACCAVEDLPDLLCGAGFDVVLASYLLHYAPTVEVLQRMCRRRYRVAFGSATFQGNSASMSASVTACGSFSKIKREYE